MPSWAFWMLFLAVGAFAVLMAKRLEDGERRRGKRRPPTTSDPGLPYELDREAPPVR